MPKMGGKFHLGGKEKRLLEGRLEPRDAGRKKKTEERKKELALFAGIPIATT